MELSALAKKGIRIKTKTVTIAINSSTDISADIAIEMDVAYPTSETTKLVIQGPGEYEVGGVHVNVVKQDAVSTYTIFDDQYRMLLTRTEAIKKMAEEEDYDAIIVYASVPTTSDTLGQLSSDVLLIFGEEKNIPLQDQSVKKMNKVNLKKKEEIKGSIVYLS